MATTYDAKQITKRIDRICDADIAAAYYLAELEALKTALVANRVGRWFDQQANKHLSGIA